MFFRTARFAPEKQSHRLPAVRSFCGVFLVEQKMNYYKRHIGDYMKDASHLSLLEHGVYMRLLDVYYTREVAIPVDQAARLIGARAKDEKEALSVVLGEFFSISDGAYSQRRCDAEIADMQKKAETNREVGKRGGRPKKVTGSVPVGADSGNPEITQMVSENNPDVTLSNNHKPITNNHSTPLPPVGDGVGVGFEVVFGEYPKKAAEAKAREAWGKLAPDAALQEQILSAVRVHRTLEQWTKEGGKFIPTLANWLTGQRWLDDVGAVPDADPALVEGSAAWLKVMGERLGVAPCGPYESVPVWSARVRAAVARQAVGV